MYFTFLAFVSSLLFVSSKQYNEKQEANEQCETYRNNELRYFRLSVCCSKGAVVNYALYISAPDCNYLKSC